MIARNPATVTPPTEFAPDELEPEASPSEAESISGANRVAREEPEPAAADAAKTPTTKKPTTLYRVVWRWHFYAGLIVSPVMLVTALTGAIYTFQHELSQWIYADLYFVEPAGEPLSYERQWEVAAEALGEGLELEGFQPSPDPTQSTVFAAHLHEGGEGHGQEHRMIYLNPYDGEVLGTMIQEREFFAVVLQIHRSLFAGTTGRIVVELCTSWGLLLLFTGTYLWWPRKKPNKGVWKPKIRGKKYRVLRDLHAVSGFYLLGVATIVLGTGLFFTFGWGTAYHLTSMAAGQSLMPIFSPRDAAEVPEGEASASLDDVVSAVFSAADVNYEDRVLMRKGEPGQQYQAFIMRNADHYTMRVAFADPHTAETEVIGVSDFPPMAHAFPLAISLHQGKTFGLPSQIAAFVACLGIMGLIVSGAWMWWVRRPRGKSGFPAPNNPGSIPRWLLAMIVGFGLFLPTVGVSLLLIL
ncbi:MAG: PepSY domain-containing protein, partial [Planctomycetota bacterium]